MPFVQTNPIQMRDNTANALVVREKVGGINYVEIDTIDGSEVIRLLPTGIGNAEYFGSSAEGITRYIGISGYKTSGSLAEARLAIGVHYDQVLSIYNAQAYYFDTSVGIGVNPAQKFEIGSNDNSDRVSIYHTNADMYVEWDDGNCIVRSVETANANTIFFINPQGTGYGQIQINDGATGSGTFFRQDAGVMRIENADFGDFRIDAPNGEVTLQRLAGDNVRCFSNAAEGETPYFGVSGYRTSGTRDEMQFAVGVHIDQVGSIYGCAGYYFDNQLIFTQSNSVLRLDTLDGSDNKILTLAGGGSGSMTRGAFIELHGNESSSNEGAVKIIAGNDAADGAIHFYTTSVNERMKIDYAGAVHLIGTGSPTQNYKFTTVDTLCTIQGSNTSYSYILRMKDALLDRTKNTFIQLYNYESGSDNEYLQVGAGVSYHEVSTRKSASGTLQPLHLFTGTDTAQLVLNIDGTITMDNSPFITTIKSGATQGGAGAVANEIWKTASHATLPDNVLMIGV